MEPQDDRQRNPSSPPEAEDAAGIGGPSADRQVIATDDAGISAGPTPRPDWASQPDQTTAIETSRIRGPNESFDPHFVLVPVETDPPGVRPHAAGGGREGGTKGRAKGGEGGGGERQGSEHDQKGSGGRQTGEGAHWYQPSSLMHGMVMPGLVALVCGFAGAWAYAYFFGPSHSDDDKTTSGKNSEPGKGSDSGKDSDPGQGSASAKKAVDPAKMLQAQAAWMDAVKELREARASEKEARRSEQEATAILEFFKKNLLLVGRSGDVSLAEIFSAGGPDKEMTLGKAVESAESRVGETFADRPLAEAAAREMLGMADMSLGEPARAVTQFERAFALREAVQGENQPETADCRNQLAVAYRLAGRTSEAGRLFDRDTRSDAHASALAVQGSMLLSQKKPADAELKLRECLTLRKKTQPDDWATFDVESMLGEALLAQRRFAEAEPMLVSGYEGMKLNEDAIPPSEKPRLGRALDRVVRLYDAWGKKDEATRWRAQLGAPGPSAAKPG